MKKIIQKLSLVSLAILFLMAGCNKDGENGWLYSESESGNGDFQPISNVTGETGWGYALIRWDLPASVKGLTMVDVSWTNAEGVTEYKKMTHFEDSLWLGLEGSDYMFRLNSLGTAGESVMDSILLKVPDWKAEPLELIREVKTNVVGNELFITWTKNLHRAYANTTFILTKKDESWSRTIVRLKEESSSVTFSELDYSTDYVLTYYSENLAGGKTEEVTQEFATDLYAPDMPVIELVDRAGEVDKKNETIVTTVYAFSAAIKWKNIDTRMDSIAIKFSGLNTESENPFDPAHRQVHEFRFKASAEEGYLTLLPGGSVTLSINAKINGQWTGARGQIITTKEPQDTYKFRYKNTPTASENKSHIGRGYEWNLTGKDGGYNKDKLYTYQELAENCATVYKLIYKPQMVDEIVLFPLINQLVVGVNNTMPGYLPGQTNGAPEIEEFMELIPRLKNLRTLQIRKGFGGNAKFRDDMTYVEYFLNEFSNKEKYPNLEIVEQVN